MPARISLNGVLRVVDQVAPTTTVLDWLRGSARLAGTKEGCAEGDCGACTILVSGPRDGGRWRAVNSCLMLVPQVDGCAMLTVEGVAHGSALHPVQQALLDAHATQCGFCTPGFVMSMVALQQDGPAIDAAAIHEPLAGNLCRCTGYRAIVDACRAMTSADAATATMLPALPSDSPKGPTASAHKPIYETETQRFYAPRTLDALLALRAAHPDAVLLAGGTDLGLRVSKGRECWPIVISTAAVEELHGVIVRDGALEVGAAATYTDLLPFLDQHIPAFAALVRRIGSRQIRNLGTLAGNLATASPIGDSLPCLVALDATVQLRSQASARTLAVSDFITGYRATALGDDEIIERISVPIPVAPTHFAAYKLAKRFDQDISTVVAALRLDCDGDRVQTITIVLGGMGPTVLRARAAECAMRGRDWRTDELADLDALLAQDFRPLSDHRGGGDYRLRAAAGLIRRFLWETRDDGAADVPLRLEEL